MRTRLRLTFFVIAVLSSITARIPYTINLIASGDVASPAANLNGPDQHQEVPFVRETIRIDNSEGIFAVDLSPDGRVLAAGAQNASLQLRDAKTGSLQFDLIGHEGDVVDIKFSRSGNRLASVAFDGIRIWRVSDGLLERLLPTKRGSVTWILFSAEGDKLFSGGPLREIPVQVWKVENGRELTPLPAQSGASKCGAVSPDGRILATSHRDLSNVETINLWEIDRRQLFTSFSAHQDETRALAFAADGQRLIAADQSGELVIWDALSGGCYSARFPRQKGDFTAMALSRDGSLLVTANRRDKFVRVWEPLTGRELARFAGHSSVVKGLALSPTGRRAVSGGFDSRIFVWNTLPSDSGSINVEQMTIDQLKQILSGEDGLAAHQLIDRLIERPALGRRVANEIIQPLTESQSSSLNHSIDNLSNADFSRRRDAMIAIDGWEDLAELALRRARTRPASFTALQRIDVLLERLHDQPCSARKRANLRSIQLLQRIGDTDSISRLTELAAGSVVDPCTHAARGALCQSNVALPGATDPPSNPSRRNDDVTPIKVAAKKSDPETVSPVVLEDESMTLARQIDRELESSWDASSVVAAPSADDYEWIRRVTLDLTGKIPLAHEVEDYADNVDPNKRARLIDRLLTCDGHRRHQVETWRELLLGPPIREGLITRAQSLGPAMEQWLTVKFEQNRGFDEIVRELLTTALPDENQDSFANHIEQGSHPLGYFFRGDDLSPSALIGDCSQLFLGIRLECARCHDHPFAPWTQDQFWGFAAFFSGVRSKSRDVVGRTMLIGEDREIASITIPDTDRTIQAQFLDGMTPTPNPGRSARESLADWITSPSNPYFARTIVNRVWAQFFGQGLAEPLDDLNIVATTQREALINLLARRFQEKKFDLRFLTRSLILTQAYQRTSRLTHDSQKTPEILAKMPIRSLSGAQLHDSLTRACGFAQFAIIPRDDRRFQQFLNSQRLEFVRRSASDTPKSETEKSMLDALHQMNGSFTDMLTHSRRDETLEVITRIPGASNNDKITSIYLSTLSRKPRPEEITWIEEILGHHPSDNGSFSFVDLFWAMINSAEFNSNH